MATEYKIVRGQNSSDAGGHGDSRVEQALTDAAADGWKIEAFTAAGQAALVLLSKTTR